MLQVWYGVPAHASEALEEACKDALPHLFAAAPDLLYQLVTMVSPRQLQVDSMRSLIAPCSLPSVKFKTTATMLPVSI